MASVTSGKLSASITRVYEYYSEIRSYRILTEWDGWEEVMGDMVATDLLVGVESLMNPVSRLSTDIMKEEAADPAK
jgi:hypothetical protein